MKNKVSKSIQKAILALLKETPGVPVNRRQISKTLNIKKKDHALFMNSLISLAKEGRIIHVKKMHYAFPHKARQVTGELRVTRSGYGFVDVEGQDIDIFISRSNMNTAFDRDIVLAQLYAASRGKRLEGFVKQVIKRFRKYIVGTFHKTEYYSYVVPDDPKIYRDIIVTADKTGNAQNGQKVLVSFDRWEQSQHNPEGTIVEILGYPDDPGVDVASIAYSFNLPVSFDAQLEKEAGSIQAKYDKETLKGRLDLRDLVCFTIDPVDAKDFDDAVSLTRLKNGNWELGVHIADVSHYVEEETAVDKEAFQRGTSVYLVDRVIPMLPEHLSNYLCSLKPNEDRMTFSCFMEINNEPDIINYRIAPSVINSKRRFTYEEVQEILDGTLEDEFAPILRDMHQLSKALTRKRFEQGGIDFETPEVRFQLDKAGRPVEIIPVKRLDSHRLVEEFMLAANQTVAKHIRKISPNKNFLLPFVYRVHERPDDTKMQRFFKLLAALDVPFKPVKRVTSRYVQTLLESIKGSNEETVIEEVALRSMMKAEYSTKNIGHFGLGFKDYTHFTSPIRRYPDLTVHRLLRLYAKNTRQLPKNLHNKLKNVCRQATKMERLAQEAERESIKLKQAEYISEYVGETFTGLVSGVMAFGVFVELHETFIEGLVAITELSDDFYIYDEDTYSLIGRDTNQQIRLGDEVRVRVQNVDMEQRKIDFILLENLTDLQRREEEKKPKRRKKYRKSKKKRK